MKRNLSIKTFRVIPLHPPTPDNMFSTKNQRQYYYKIITSGRMHVPAVDAGDVFGDLSVEIEAALTS